jgi:hypothetical protein
LDPGIEILAGARVHRHAVRFGHVAQGAALIAPEPAEQAVLNVFWFNCFLWFWSGSFFGFGRGAC